MLRLILAKMEQFLFAVEEVTDGPREGLDFHVCTECFLKFLFVEGIEKYLWQFFHFLWLSCRKKYWNWERGWETEPGGESIHHLVSGGKYRRIKWERCKITRTQRQQKLPREGICAKRKLAVSLSSCNNTSAFSGRQCLYDPRRWFFFIIVI